MASVYTLPVVRTVVTTGADQLLATVPIGEVWVVRDLVLSAPSGTSVAAILYVLVPGIGGIHLFKKPLPNDSTVHLETRQALQAGDQLFITVEGAGGAVTLLITAYVFAAP